MLIVADAARSTGEGTPPGSTDAPRYEVVSLQQDVTQPRNVGVLVGLSTVLFGFLAAMAFGIVGGVAVAVAGAMGHAVARFVQLRRRCPIAPGRSG